MGIFEMLPFRLGIKQPLLIIIDIGIVAFVSINLCFGWGQGR